MFIHIHGSTRMNTCIVKQWVRYFYFHRFCGKGLTMVFLIFNGFFPFSVFTIESFTSSTGEPGNCPVKTFSSLISTACCSLLLLHCGDLCAFELKLLLLLVHSHSVKNIAAPWTTFPSWHVPPTASSKIFDTLTTFT